MMKEYKNIDLKPMNTFGISARCARLVEFGDAADLKELFAAEPIAEGRWGVLSGGSNIIFTQDYDGVLLHPVGKEITLVSETAAHLKVRAQAGVEWDDFVEWCVGRELWGAENLSYIPGYVGASPVQNIGAYGVEAKDIIESVEMFCVDTLSMLTLARDHCNFGYRDSIFKGVLKGKVVITAVNFILGKEARPDMGYGDLRDKVEEMGGATPANIRRAVTSIRKSKLPEPSEIGNAGSFFKNPVVEEGLAAALKEQYPSMPLYPSGRDGFAKLAAGWLIDRCGLKGHRSGNVGVHERQALVLVNYGGATGREILDFAATVQAAVRERFGVELQMEVNVL